jgi:hypothetical protein
MQQGSLPCAHAEVDGSCHSLLHPPLPYLSPLQTSTGSVSAFTEKPRSRSTGVRKRAGAPTPPTRDADAGTGAGAGPGAPRSVFNRLYNQAVPVEFRDPDLLRRMAETVSKKKSTPGPATPAQRSHSAGARVREPGAAVGGGLKDPAAQAQRQRLQSPGGVGGAAAAGGGAAPGRTSNVWSRMYDDAVWMPSIQDFEKLVRQRTTAARRQTAAQAAASTRPRPSSGQVLKPQPRTRGRGGSGPSAAVGVDSSSSNSSSMAPTINTDFEDQDRSGARSQVRQIAINHAQEVQLYGAWLHPLLYAARHVRCACHACSFLSM